MVTAIARRTQAGSPRAILLARVSTSKESQETSLDRQLAMLRATAEARSWRVVRELVVDESGRDVLGRSDVREALDLVVRQRAEILVVDHIFRLGRNAKEMLEAVDVLAAAGGAFYEQERHIDTTGPFGRLLFTVLAAVGEFYARDLSRKVREGLAAARARGEVFGRRRKLNYDKLPRAGEMRKAGASWRAIADELGGGTPGAWSRALDRYETDTKDRSFVQASVGPNAPLADTAAGPGRRRSARRGPR